MYLRYPQGAKAPPKFPAWTKTVPEVAQYFEVDLAKGLSPSDVAAKRKVYGYNELDKEEGKPLWKLVLEQFDDPLVKVWREPAGAGTARLAHSRNASFNYAHP